MKIPAQVDYEEKGHPSVWPGGEPQEILAKQADTWQASSR